MNLGPSRVSPRHFTVRELRQICEQLNLADLAVSLRGV